MTSDTAPSHFYVYVLISLKDQKFYVGFTEDLKRRMEEHTLGKVISTKNRRPLELIHYEMYITKEDALAREIFLKSGFGREQLRLSLKQTLKNHSGVQPKSHN
ncbi:MAG: GIY-YIG nuclease family protein [Nitrosopumilales archaeon]|nr:MAG: GIY-YIG nuclease family protein [Nitrosopumilales archaeon]